MTFLSAPVTLRSFALASVLLLLPAVGMSQTLCRANEVDYFSCVTAPANKIVSVCGNITKGGIDDDSWLQYRFGRTDAIELAYPTTKRGSIEKFEGNHFNKYRVIDLRFVSGKTLYGVELNDAYDGEDAQARHKPSGGVSVQISKSKSVSIECRTVSVSKYYSVFSDLNDSLRAYNGETDFLYHFYNHVSR